MLRLVVFDFDGVIADSEPVHYEMLRQTLADNGVSLSWPDYKTGYLGYEDYECIRRILQDQGQDASAKKVEELVRVKQEKMARQLTELCVINPGVPELLADLRRNGIHRAICSGAIRREIEAILEHNRLREFFDLIVSADDVRAGKPDPEGYRLSVTRFNQSSRVTPPIAPAETLAIEDSMWGIHAARAAGLCCLAVTTSYTAADLADAHAVIPSLAEANAARLRAVVNGKC